MSWLALGLVVATGLVVTRWSVLRVDSLGRAKAFPYAAVTVLLACAVVVALPVLLRHREESRLAAAASQLAGRRVTVSCQTFGQSFVDAGAELGYVKYDASGRPEAHTLIKRDACSALRGYLRSGRSSPTFDQVVAVHVLTHESMHMSGQTNEALAECAAVQRDAMTAQLLGATEEQGLALARRYWREVYPRMPDDYVSPNCRPGGSLDEHLADSSWPP